MLNIVLAPHCLFWTLLSLLSTIVIVIPLRWSSISSSPQKICWLRSLDGEEHMLDCHFKVHKTDSCEKSCHLAFVEHKISKCSLPAALSTYEHTNISAEMKFEDILEEAGGFGRFQVFTLFLLCLPRLILPLHFLLHNFLAAIPPHRCAIPPQDPLANLTEEEVLLVSIPKDPEEAFSSCEMFTEPQFHLLLNSTQWKSGNVTAVQRCQQGWVYDQSQFTSTVATQVSLPPFLSFGENVCMCMYCMYVHPCTCVLVLYICYSKSKEVLWHP